MGANCNETVKKYPWEIAVMLINTRPNQKEGDIKGKVGEGEIQRMTKGMRRNRDVQTSINRL